MKQENLNVINSEAMVDKISGEMMSELTGSGSGSGSGSGCGSASGSGSGSGEKEPELDSCPLTGGTHTFRPINFPETLFIELSWGSGEFKENTPIPSVSAQYIDYKGDLNDEKSSLTASWSSNYIIQYEGKAVTEELGNDGEPVTDKDGNKFDVIIKGEYPIDDYYTIPDSFRVAPEEGQQ